MGALEETHSPCLSGVGAGSRTSSIYGEAAVGPRLARVSSGVQSRLRSSIRDLEIATPDLHAHASARSQSRGHGPYMLESVRATAVVHSAGSVSGVRRGSRPSDPQHESPKTPQQRSGNAVMSGGGTAASRRPSSRFFESKNEDVYRVRMEEPHQPGSAACADVSGPRQMPPGCAQQGPIQLVDVQTTLQTTSSDGQSASASARQPVHREAGAHNDDSRRLSEPSGVLALFVCCRRPRVAVS